jgi:tetratricopeptide (TPR) repeat protein
MASVFLSYDRDDSDKARSLAHSLETAGHEVWWDLHVRGGAQFSKVIEEALKAADVIVVLWSRNSVDSAWVRDEAAAGRDSGRLVPVTIDCTSPPLGFRQFQTIDMSASKSRARAAALKTLLQDIGAVATSSASSGAATSAREMLPEQPRSRKWPSPLVLGAVAALLVIAGAIVLLRPWGAAPGNATVLVTAGHADGSSQSLARDLAVQLGGMPVMQSGVLRLVTSIDGQKPQLVLEATRLEDARSPGASLLLKNAPDGALVWSQDFDQGSRTASDLTLQMALTAASVLDCAADAVGDDGRLLPRKSRSLFLSSCSQTAKAPVYDVQAVAAGLSKVVAEAPRFAPAWRRLLIAQANLIDGDQADASDEARLRTYVAAARRLDPNMPEMTVAESVLVPRTDPVTRLRLIDQAYRDDPDNAEVLIRRTELLEDVGRIRDALYNALEAIQKHPDSPAVLYNYISALAISGQTDFAEQQLRHAEQLWQGTSALEQAQWDFYFRFGDPKTGLQLASERSVSPSMLLFLHARANPTDANVEKLISFYMDRSSNSENLASLDMLMQAFAQFHREDQLYPIVLRWPKAAEFAEMGNVWFRPALREFRRDPRFMQILARTPLLNYWRTTGKWPDFCSEPDLPYNCMKEAARLST